MKYFFIEKASFLGYFWLLSYRNWRHLSQCKLVFYCFVPNSWEICQCCAKILLAAEHKMQSAYYLRNTYWFQRCSDFSFFDEPVIILFTIFY